MTRVFVSERADADVDDIFEVIRQSAGYGAAVEFDTNFNRFFDQLAKFPRSGPARPELGRNLRIGVVSPYLVIYRYKTGGDTINVLRIVHGHRRISPRLLRSAP